MREGLQGSALLRRVGEGREFESLREFRADDDYRSIDWKATARKTLPITRQYQAERNQRIFLLLDAGRTMASRSGELTKLDHAVNAALLVAFAALRNDDLVGLIGFSDRIKVCLPPGKGREQLRLLSRSLSELGADRRESDYDLSFGEFERRSARRTLMILFTDFLDPGSAESVTGRIGKLSRRHLPLIALIRDRDVTEAAYRVPSLADDPFVRGSAREVCDELEGGMRRLRCFGADVVHASAEMMGRETLKRYLNIKQKALL